MFGRILAIILWPVFWLIFPLRLRASVLILVGEEVLVVNHKIYFKKWGLPGGGVKLTEKAEDAAIREVREELGLQINFAGLRRLNDSPDIIKEFGIISRHIFFLCKLDKKPNVSTNGEIKSHKWIKVDSEIVGKDVKRAVSMM